MAEPLTISSNRAQMIKDIKELPIVLGVVGVILLLVVPVPPFMLDILLVASIAMSVLILLLGIYASKPLDFSVFPTLLLLGTLARLALNIASTRLILQHGADGDAAAGNVIKAFGHFVTGGNYVIGFIVFIILVLINFVVITKGAGRIAEVAARFTLDAMPGKQLAIDADLNAGLINETESKARREKLENESDFYGSMDGASKFVRGDAIAGIIITFINVVGGFIIGVLQQGMSISDAGKVYTILTVGDGLVSQMPALIVSVAAGLIVTKVSKKELIADEIRKQAFGKWKPLGITGVILGLMGLMPGLPMLPFLLLGGILGTGAFYVRRQDQEVLQLQQVGAPEVRDDAVAEQKELVPLLDPLELEVGYDLIPLVDQKSGGDFPARIIGIRKQFAGEMGVVIPSVHIRDNLKLRPNEYRIYIKGALVAKAELMPHHCLALDPGYVTRKIDGITTVDPTFGLPAIWIPEAQRESAIVYGYTVVDLSSVMATHFIEIIRKNLHELFGRQDLDNLVTQLKNTHPRIVNDLIPDLLPFGVVLKTLQNLLREKVSIRDLLTIFETLAHYAGISKDADRLTEHVRVAVGRNICQQVTQNDQLNAITLARELEDKLIHSVSQTTEGDQIVIEPSLAKRMVEEIGNQVKKHMNSQQTPILLTSQQVRPHLYKLIEKFIPNLAVLSHSEVAGRVNVQNVAKVVVQL